MLDWLPILVMLVVAVGFGMHVAFGFRVLAVVLCDVSARFEVLYAAGLNVHEGRWQ